MKPISCMVETATSFFKSICTHIFKEASITLKKTNNVYTGYIFSLNVYKNLYKPNTATLTKIPLRKIEKPVLASTWVLLNQK